MKIKVGKQDFALIDDEDYEKLSKYKWHCVNRKTVQGQYARCQQKNKDGSRLNILMHRLVNNTPPGFETDHINGNRLDNRKCNLRTCTRNQNSFNRVKIGRLKYKGITRTYTNIYPYAAAIGFKGKTINLGRFKTKKEAAIKYNEYAIKLFGEFARLNDV